MLISLFMSCTLLSKVQNSLYKEKEIVKQEKDRGNVFNQDIIQTIEFSGKIVENRYIDKDNGLKVPVNDAVFEIGHTDSNRKLKAIYTNFTIEYWFFDDILIQPVPLQDCTWDFIDRGMYQSTKKYDINVVATCFPKENNDYITFGYFSYINGGTWQIEAHLPIDKMLESKKEAETVISQLSVNNVYVWKSLVE